MRKKWIVFFGSDGKEIFSMTMNGMSNGELSATLGLLAYERGIPAESISFAELTR